MLMTTLNQIRKYSPCELGWKTLLRSLNKTDADDEPLSFAHILESNGLMDTIWCLRTTPEAVKVAATFAKWCALEAKHAYDAYDAAADDAYAAYAAAAAAYAADDDAAATAAYAADAAYAAHAAAAYAAAARESQKAKLLELISC